MERDIPDSNQHKDLHPAAVRIVAAAAAVGIPGIRRPGLLLLWRIRSGGRLVGPRLGISLVRLGPPVAPYTMSHCPDHIPCFYLRH